MPAAAVYVITHLPTKRHYVGKSRNPKARWRQHLRGVSTRRSYIQRALRSHPVDEFVMQVLEWHPSDDEAYEAESFWVEFLRSNRSDYGFNLSEGGGGNRGFNVTPETRAKMSANSIARWARPGERERNAAQTVALHTGMKRSAETCSRISAALKGRSISPEQKQRISEFQKGKKKPWISEKWKGRLKTPEHVAKVAAWHTGKKRSEEARAAMRDAWARRKALARGTG
jgi:group I intron endonuclease